MSHTRVSTALALAALVSALPAAASQPPQPRSTNPASFSLVRQALGWIAALWSAGPERAVSARAETGGGLTPDAGSKALAIPSRPIPLPAGGGIDPDGCR